MSRLVTLEGQNFFTRDDQFHQLLRINHLFKSERLDRDTASFRSLASYIDGNARFLCESIEFLEGRKPYSSDIFANCWVGHG